MIKGKRGMSAFFLLMIFVVFIILGLALAKPLTEFSSDAQGVNGLDCGNVTGYQDKANCTSVDFLPFLYVVIAFGLAFIIIKGVGQ